MKKLLSHKTSDSDFRRRQGLLEKALCKNQAHALPYFDPHDALERDALAANQRAHVTRDSARPKRPDGNHANGNKHSRQQTGTDIRYRQQYHTHPKTSAIYHTISILTHPQWLSVPHLNTPAQIVDRNRPLHRFPQTSSSRSPAV